MNFVKIKYLTNREFDYHNDQKTRKIQEQNGHIWAPKLLSNLYIKIVYSKT